jgi:hypothetical protein
MSVIYRHTYGEHSLNSLVENSLNLAANCYRSLSDTCIGMDGMSGYKYRFFVNNLMKQLTNPKYLEVGVMGGSSLCSAIDGVYNGVTAVGIDNYGSNIELFEQAKSAVAAVATTSNISVSILNKDFLNVDFSKLGLFNVYLYDVGRRQANYELSLVQARSALANDLVFIVGDWDHAYGGMDSELNTGIRASIVQAGYNIQYHVNIQSGGYYESVGNASNISVIPWQNGYGIFVLTKSPVAPVVADENYEV